MVYRGIESGQIEAVFKAASPESLARPYRTGLEGSAVGGNYPCSFIFRGCWEKPDNCLEPSFSVVDPLLCFAICSPVKFPD